MNSIKKLIFAAAALLSLAAFSSCTKTEKTYEELLIGDWNINSVTFVENGQVNTYEEVTLECAGKHSIKYSAGTLTIYLVKDSYIYSLNIPDLGETVNYDEAIYGTFTQEGVGTYAGSIKFTDRNNLLVILAETEKNGVGSYDGQAFTCSRKWL